MSEVLFEAQRYPLAPGESVLDCLLAAGHELPHGCKAGACQSCLMQAEGPVPAAAQSGLRDTERALGFFLPCLCRPSTPLAVRRPQQAALRHACTVRELRPLNAEVMRLRLSLPDGFDYRPGQYLTLWRSDTLGRSYSLASVPGEDFLELHVRRVPDGRVSGWVHDVLQPGATVQVSAAIGNCFYTAAAQERPLLLLGTSTGLAPLYGILRDALAQGHRAPVHLLHGALQADGLYYRDELAALAARQPLLRYRAHALEGGADDDVERMPLEQAALALDGNFADWTIFLCGAPALVNTLRKKLFLAGAAMRNIHADAFLASPAPS